MIYDMVNSSSAPRVSARTAIVSNLSDSFLTALKNSSFIIPRFRSHTPVRKKVMRFLIFFFFLFFRLFSKRGRAGIEKGLEGLLQLRAAQCINTSDS